MNFVASINFPKRMLDDEPTGELYYIVILDVAPIFISAKYVFYLADASKKRTFTFVEEAMREPWI